MMSVTCVLHPASVRPGNSSNGVLLDFAMRLATMDLDYSNYSRRSSRAATKPGPGLVGSMWTHCMPTDAAPVRFTG